MTEISTELTDSRDPDSTEPTGKAIEEWHAPPGAAPPKSRRSRLLANEGNEPTGPGVPLKRMKVVEDFGGADFEQAAEDDDHTVVPALPLSRERSRTLTDFRSRTFAPDEAPPEEPAKRWSPPSLSTLITMTGMLGLLGLAVFGAWHLVSPTAAVRSFGSESEPIPDLGLSGEQRKNAPGSSRPKMPAAAPRTDDRPRKSPADPFVVWHLQSTSEDSALLTIESDVQALVFIDGHRVRKPTPLVDYPVSPGEHKIALVDTTTGERRSFAVRLSPRQSSRLEEIFGPAPKRR